MFKSQNYSICWGFCRYLSRYKNPYFIDVFKFFKTSVIKKAKNEEVFLIGVDKILKRLGNVKDLSGMIYTISQGASSVKGIAEAQRCPLGKEIFIIYLMGIFWVHEDSHQVYFSYLFIGNQY